jgi:hypothetical protein
VEGGGESPPLTNVPSLVIRAGGEKDGNDLRQPPGLRRWLKGHYHLTSLPPARRSRMHGRRVDS